MFEKGEYVIYGHVGICQVMGTTTMDLDGIPKDRLYYVLQPDGKGSGRIYTPVDNGKPVLRKIMTRDEAEALISDIPEIETLEIENDKLREEKYKECLKTCNGRELIRIIKTIYSRRRQRLKSGKKVTAVDERYMKLAEDNLYAELAMLLEIPKDHVVSYISQKCGNTGA
ncbi:MAG: CarD family transcriptional regulator [Blautia sp.]|nr:CarD family transcriptional regulator [Blautia sp.]